MQLSSLGSSFIILFREGFEAMLIVMLAFSYCNKIGLSSERKSSIWYGISLAFMSSIVIAYFFTKFSLVSPGIRRTH